MRKLTKEEKKIQSLQKNLPRMKKSVDFLGDMKKAKTLRRVEESVYELYFHYSVETENQDTGMTYGTGGNTVSRIELTDTGMTMLMKLAEGNPGALTVLMKILRDGDIIDPQAWSGNGGLAAIMSLNEYEIYGGRIWCLYKDVCAEDSLKFVAVLRAVQLGIITRVRLNHAVDNRGAGLDMDAVVTAVQAELKLFGKACAQPTQQLNNQRN